MRNLKLKLKLGGLLGGVNYGLLTDLLNQSGNDGQCKVRTIFNGIVSGGEYQGSYNNVATYSKNQIIGYPVDSAPLRYRANQSTSAGQSPDTNPEKWDLQVGIEWLQDLGGGFYSRYSMGIRNDAMIRLNGLEVGTYANSSFTRRSSFYDVTGLGTTTSVTSMAIPSSHPSSRTIIVGTGLNIPNSATLSGTCTDNFAIPTTHPTLAIRNLPSGLNLVTGDLIVMYGDASNFFGYVIARYNNATGVAYGASTFHVGSGTFSSWTLKKERLIYIERTADPVGKNLYCLAQTYDSATGSLTFNSINNTGTTTNSDWTIYISAKQPSSIPASNNSRYNGTQSNNPFGTYGLWHMKMFQGNRLIHNSTKANNGTGWVYIYVDGPDLSSPPSDVEIDTYNPIIISQGTLTFDNLTSGVHTIIAFSKVSASGSSTNTRPYIDAGTTTPNHSFLEQYNYDVFTPTITLGARGGESFGEIAWRFRDVDVGDATHWLPEHSGIITTELVSKSLLIDGVVVDMSDENAPYQLKFKDASIALLTQSLKIVHPQATGDMGSMATTHSFGSKGVDYIIQVTWAQAGLIETGYNNMIFLGEAWFNKVLGQDAQVIVRPPDNTSENLSESEAGQQSYLFYSTGTSPLEDYVIGQFWANPARDWRTGLPNVGIPFIQDFTGSANAKWYPVAFSNYPFAQDEAVIVQGKLFIGNKGDLVLT